jgi:hypothetical protein
LRVVVRALADARTARSARRFDEARAQYTRAIQASPESAFLYRDRAAVAREQRDDDRRRWPTCGVPPRSNLPMPTAWRRWAPRWPPRGSCATAEDDLPAGVRPRSVRCDPDRAGGVVARQRDAQLPAQVRDIEGGAIDARRPRGAPRRPASSACCVGDAGAARHHRSARRLVASAGSPRWRAPA